CGLARCCVSARSFGAEGRFARSGISFGRTPGRAPPTPPPGRGSLIRGPGLFHASLLDGCFFGWRPSRFCPPRPFLIRLGELTAPPTLRRLLFNWLCRLDR